MWNSCALNLLLIVLTQAKDCAEYGIDCPSTGSELVSRSFLELRWPTSRKEVSGTVCPPGAITARGHTDGFGSQYAAMISVFAYSFELDVPYCYTPWEHIAHYNHSMDKVRNLFRFVGGHLLGYKAEENTTVIMNAHRQMDTRYVLYPEVSQRIRSAYWAVPKPPLRYYKKKAFNLAVHIRRGDVGPDMDQKNAGRYTSDESISLCLSKIVPDFQKQYKRGVAISVFSEGKAKDFHIRAPHSDLRVEFHLNTGIAETFHHLVTADALVIAHSSLSYCAAFISVGRVFAPQPDPDLRLNKQISGRLQGRIENC